METLISTELSVFMDKELQHRIWGYHTKDFTTEFPGTMNALAQVRVSAKAHEIVTNTTRYKRFDNWKIEKIAPKKTWMAQFADDLVHFTIIEGKQAAANCN